MEYFERAENPTSPEISEKRGYSFVNVNSENYVNVQHVNNL